MRFLLTCVFALCFSAPAQAGLVFYSSDHDIFRADEDGRNGTAIVTDVAARHLAYNPADDKLYWVSEAHKRIQRSNLDGTDVETLLNTGLSQPVGLSVDSVNGHIYFSDLGSDRISRINLDGTGRVDLITSGLGGPRGIALDVANGHFYWTDEGTDSIRRADLDGTNHVNIVTGLDAPRSVAIDLANSHLYWTDAFAHNVGRSNLDGSGRTTLIADSDVTSMGGISSGLRAIDQITLDPINGKLFVADGFGGNKVIRANLDGSGIETIGTGNAVGVLFVDVTPVPEPSSLALLGMGLLGLGGTRLRRRKDNPTRST